MQIILLDDIKSHTVIFTGDVDYQSLSDSLIFNEVTSRVCKDISITDDPIREGEEMFHVTLESPGGDVELDPDSGVVTIIDEDGND